jgi:hypothetical protein
LSDESATQAVYRQVAASPSKKYTSRLSELTAAADIDKVKFSPKIKSALKMNKNQSFLYSPYSS